MKRGTSFQLRTGAKCWNSMKIYVGRNADSGAQKR